MATRNTRALFVTKLPRDCLCVNVSDDALGMKRLLQEANLHDNNVGARIVHNKKRAMYLAMDGSRPVTSSAEVAAAISDLTDHHVCVCITDVKDPHRLMLVLAVWKACYSFNVHKTDQTSNKHISFLCPSTPHTREMERLLESLQLAADVENEPANVVTPESLALRIAAWFPKHASNILHLADLRKEGLGLVQAVGQGSASPPCMLLLDSEGGNDTPYTPRPKKQKNQRTVVIIGKGVLFDSGGLSIKLRSMYGMHGDKSGAAVAAAIFHHFYQSRKPCKSRATTTCKKSRATTTCSKQQQKTRLIVVLPFVENVISATAVRPGDVVTACDGTTVEVVDPDAEGRLILADAMAYATKRYSPDLVIDFATMTGYGSSVHHDLSAAFFTTNQLLAKAAYEVGEHTGERTWGMPPWLEYASETQSAVADLRNAGWNANDDEGVMGALFLSNFAPTSASWIHFDIAKNTTSKSGSVFTATGVALGVEFLRMIHNSLHDCSFP